MPPKDDGTDNVTMAPEDSCEKCEECNEVGKDTCPTCNTGNYCSEACQKVALPTHRLLCESFKKFQNPPLSSDPRVEFVRAIMLHHGESGPRFVWLKTKLTLSCKDEEGKDLHRLEALPGSLLWKEDGKPESITEADIDDRMIHSNYALDRKLANPFIFMFRDKFRRDGSKLNNAMRSIVDPKSKYLMNWSGPLIIYARKEVRPRLSIDEDISATGGADLTPNSIRIVQHYLNCYLLSVVHHLTGSDLFRELTVVRLNCVGDTEIQGRPALEPVKLLGYHWEIIEDVLPLSELIGLPIMAMRVTGSYKRWADHAKVKRLPAFANLSILNLFRGFHPRILSEPETALDLKHYYPYGKVPSRWMPRTGSVLIVRRDRKPLLLAHARALLDYMEYIGDFFDLDIGGRVTLLGNVVLKEVSKTKFLGFFEVWKSRHPDMRDLVSPYNV